jgi:hypothetical protein
MVVAQENYIYMYSETVHDSYALVVQVSNMTHSIR